MENGRQTHKTTKTDAKRETDKWKKKLRQRDKQAVKETERQTGSHRQKYKQNERQIKGRHRYTDVQKKQLSNLEIVGQLRAASITRVHGDADVAVGVEVELCALKHKPVHVGLDRTDDAQDLKAHSPAC